MLCKIPDCITTNKQYINHMINYNLGVFESLISIKIVTILVYTTH